MKTETPGQVLRRWRRPRPGCWMYMEGEDELARIERRPTSDGYDWIAALPWCWTSIGTFRAAREWVQGHLAIEDTFVTKRPLDRGTEERK